LSKKACHSWHFYQGEFMAQTANTTPAGGEQLPVYFIVELKTEAGVRYALCERMTVVAAGAESLPTSTIEAMFHGNVLRAVALPSGPDGGQPHRGLTELMSLFQSGRAPSINITINNRDSD
jgi:hypothetical protein